jgi:hypothetical protein
MATIVLLVVVTTSVWVWLDAHRLGVVSSGEPARRGHLQADMGPFGWGICCLLLWIVAFPLYLSKRPRYKCQFRGNRAGLNG